METTLPASRYNAGKLAFAALFIEDPPFSPSPYPSASCLSFSVFLCVAVQAYLRERGGWGSSSIKRRRRSLVFYNAFTPLWFTEQYVLTSRRNVTSLTLKWFLIYVWQRFFLAWNILVNKNDRRRVKNEPASFATTTKHVQNTMQASQLFTKPRKNATCHRLYFTLFLCTTNSFRRKKQWDSSKFAYQYVSHFEKNAISHKLIARSPSTPLACVQEWPCWALSCTSWAACCTTRSYLTAPRAPWTHTTWRRGSGARSPPSPTPPGSTASPPSSFLSAGTCHRTNCEMQKRNFLRDSRRNLFMQFAKYRPPPQQNFIRSFPYQKKFRGIY